jgi:hypothetical protein
MLVALAIDDCLATENEAFRCILKESGGLGGGLDTTPDHIQMTEVSFRTIVSRGRKLRWFFQRLQIQDTIISFLDIGGLVYFPWSTLYEMKNTDLATLANYFITTGSYELYLVLKDFGLLITEDFPFHGPIHPKASLSRFQPNCDEDYEEPYEIHIPQKSESSYDGTDIQLRHPVTDKDKEIEQFLETLG